MRYMFGVRSARAPAPTFSRGPPRACRLRRRPPTPCMPLGPHFTPHLMPYATISRPKPPESFSRALPVVEEPFSRALPGVLLLTRQGETAFNQPLSFNTSSVTNMLQMFKVRSARALGPSLQSDPPCARRLRCPRPTPSRLSRAAPRPARRPISTRQGASAFNQPLSFDTSSVTDMLQMFYVRSARAQAPSLQSVPSRVHASSVATPSRLPGLHLAPHRTPSFRLGRARRRSTSR